MQNSGPSDQEVETMENAPYLLARGLATEIPEVKETLVIEAPDANENHKGIIKYGASGIKADKLYVTPNFFEIFNYCLIEGNRHHAFPNTNSILLSSATAEKLFHITQNLNGKMISWDRGTGEFTSNPDNSLEKMLHQSLQKMAKL